MRLLILGGVREARQLAQKLAPYHEVIYSVAGKGRIPDLPCPVRVGGFGGIAGLRTFLEEQHIELLIDATHPYAAQISHHAVQAARSARIPLWAWRRPAWQATVEDDWRFARDWREIRAMLQAFRRPLFTIGLEPLQHLQDILPYQHWVVRCLNAVSPGIPRLTVLCTTGPFSLEHELALLRDYRVDVLVAKNSGGKAVSAKLAAARQQRLPVVIVERPVLPEADREFVETSAIVAALAEPDASPHALGSSKV